MERRFNIGDRVVALEEQSGHENIIGVHGTVISISDTTGNPGVEFDECIDGHNCGGRGKSKYCLYVRPEKLIHEDDYLEDKGQIQIDVLFDDLFGD